MTTRLSRTPLYEDHLRLGARLVPYAGFEMPVQYQGVVAEHHAVRTRAGIFDVSHMGELSVRGPNAAALTDRLLTNDLVHLPIGRALYTCCCSQAGMILDDLIVYKRDEHDILIVCNASNRSKIVQHVTAELSGKAEVEDQSDQTALMALQGPRAFDILEAALVEPIGLMNSLPSFAFTQARVSGIECTLARTGYTGEDGVEIFVARDQASPLFQALLKHGQNAGLAPCGLAARDTLRLEARLSLYGNEIDETTSPLEAGLGWTVKWNKPDFIGKAALEALRARGVAQKLVGFEVLGKGVARHGYSLASLAKEVVGRCTSGAPSPTLGKNIGLGYLPASMSEVGTPFLLDYRGKWVEAEVVKTPFYKRGGVS